MEIKKGFRMRTICGQHVISGEGSANVNFSSIISLNDTAAYLFEAVQGKSFTADTLRELLLAEYDVTPEKADEDAKALCARWLEIGLASE